MPLVFSSSEPVGFLNPPWVSIWFGSGAAVSPFQPQIQTSTQARTSSIWYKEAINTLNEFHNREFLIILYHCPKSNIPFLFHNRVFVFDANVSLCGCRDGLGYLMSGTHEKKNAHATHSLRHHSSVYGAVHPSDYETQTALWGLTPVCSNF